MKTRAPGQTGSFALRATARLGVCTLLLTAHCALAGGAFAQSPAPLPAPPLVHYGKWAALGLAASFTIFGVQSHDRADRDFGALLTYCRSTGPCSLGGDGRYTNPTAEALYQRVRTGDRTARAWLVGGQVALAGGAVLFVLELRRRKGPENIPFSPYVVGGRFGTLLGMQIAWK